jgi:DNA processing protein
MDVNSLKLNQSDYPSTLRTIASPPKELFWSGAPPRSWLNKPRVAIVGSRKITPYGQAVTSKIAGELAKAGVVIISGLAFGVDICAHQAALNQNGVTVAVLGTPINDIYPAVHANIASRIAIRGSLLSEYPEGMPGLPRNFVARNRIISGLCDVLVITEAALKSGSLHTARFALEQGKTVMAVPGNINSPMSEGANNLIRSGAIPVTGVNDIFFALGLKPTASKAAGFKGGRSESLVLSFIKEGVTSQDDLAVAAALDSRRLASALTMLELEGLIRPAGGGNWVLD